MGAGRQDMVNHVAAQTMLMVAITSVIMGAAPGYVLSPYLLRLIGVAPDVYHGALGFMRVSFIGIIFVFLYGMFQALMRGVGETQMPLIIILRTVILNFMFDPLFIFGWGWFSTGQGVMGAALATLSTQGLAAVLGMIIFLRGRHGIQLGWRDFRPDPQYIKRAFLLRATGLDRAFDARARAIADDFFGNRLWDRDPGRLWYRVEHPAVHRHSSNGAVDGGIHAGQPKHRSGEHPTRLPRDASWARCGVSSFLPHRRPDRLPVRARFGSLLCSTRYCGHCRRRGLYPRDVLGVGLHWCAALRQCPRFGRPETCSLRW